MLAGRVIWWLVGSNSSYKIDRITDRLDRGPSRLTALIVYLNDVTVDPIALLLRILLAKADARRDSALLLLTRYKSELPSSKRTFQRLSGLYQT